MTEWGPSGDWQVPQTSWKASIEETSTEKAQRYLERYQNVMLKDTERCLGSYVFIWQWRRERTQTWYGMFLESGERTEAVNVMQYHWTGKWPANRAPRVEPLRSTARPRPRTSPEAREPHAAESRWRTRMATASRSNGRFWPKWRARGYAGRGEQQSKPMPELIQKAGEGQLSFVAPEKEGAYRVFVFVLDGAGNAATANIPFFVRP